MAGEVISLLSSSPTHPLLQTQPPTARPNTQNPPPAKTSTFSDDVFDLTDDPPQDPAASKPSDTSDSLPLSPQKLLNDGTAKGLFFLSDDFDTTGDLDNGQEWDGPLKEDTGNGNKRRRLSPSLDIAKSTSKMSPSATNEISRSSVRQPAKGLRRSQTLPDPIEFSSSPRGPYMPTSAQQPTRDTFDDPFASTPPAAKPVATRATKIPAPPSSDPFASDPPAPAPKAKVPVTVIDLDSEDFDPFASSARKATHTPSQEMAGSKDTVQPASKPRPPKQIADWDPISSSAPEPYRRSEPLSSSPPRTRLPKDKEKNTGDDKGKEKAKKPAVIDLSDSDASVCGLNTRDQHEDEDELPDLDDIDFTKYRARRPKSSSPPPSRPTTSRTFSRTTSLPNPRSKPKKSTGDKARDKEARTAEKEREKERKRREKETAKEQKAQEKARAAALVEVNKVRTDKKVSTPEMIVDLPSTLPPTTALQAQQLLKDLDVETTTWQTPGSGTEYDSNDFKAVKWRRKVRSRFNDALDMWEPIAPRVEDEPFALVIVTADEFVALALASAGEEKDLEAHVQRTHHHLPTQQLIYLIEGLTPWMRKNRNVRNRQFVSAVRAQEVITETNNSTSSSSNAGTGARRQRKPPQAPKHYIDEDAVEDALLELQVLHGVHIHHTSAPVETAQWIAVFTQHVSTAPYRRQKDAANAAGAGFCMESGQVRTGDGPRDTYVKMLQEIVRVTAPIAYGVAAEFGTVTELVRGFEDRGPLALEGCRKSANRDGAPSDRAVGQAVSRRLCKVVTGRDEMSTDV